MFNLINQKHPKGLYLLFCVEMWERFAYYGMRAMLVLYMIQGLVFSTQQASIVYGVYTGLVYLTPIIGGYLADRYLGQRKCITIGAVLMIIGLLTLCIDNQVVFFLALFIMIVANGFFKSNISTIVGMLYDGDNEKKDSGFTIFYMGINLGALLSPLICGTLAVLYGFRVGFLSAGIGMLIGLSVYKLFEKKLLKDYGLKPSFSNVNSEEKFSVVLTKEEKRKIFSLFVLMFFSILFWIGYEQAGSSLTLFAEYAINRSLFGFVIPTEYFQSLNPMFIIILAPLISYIWIFMNKRGKEPSSVSKFAIAFLVISMAYFLLYLVTKSGEAVISPIWLAIYYFISTIAELCLSPIGLSLVSKLAPVQFASMLMGTWFLASFIGNLFAGVFAGFYNSVSHNLFFLFFAVILFLGGVFLLLLKPRLVID